MADTPSEEHWEGVAPAANESEAALIAGFLESRGIPARVVDRSFHQTPTENEDLSPIEVAVHAERAEEARKELAAREKASRRIPGPLPISRRTRARGTFLRTAMADRVTLDRILAEFAHA